MSRTIDEWGDTYKAGYKTGHASRDAEVAELKAKLTEAEARLAEIYATEPVGFLYHNTKRTGADLPPWYRHGEQVPHSTNATPLIPLPKEPT